jgi:hypothetical protein
MRMWMVDPRIMCRKHLLGEHVECHMLYASIARGKYPHSDKQKRILDPSSLHRRHSALAQEVERRGYNHKSPMPPFPDDYTPPHGEISLSESLSDLFSRCRDCGQIYIE